MGTRVLELDTIQYPSASTENIQVGSGSVTFPSGITVDINGGTIDGTTIGASSATTAVFSSADINGGTVDGAAINNTTVGASTPNTGKFTTLESTGNATLGDASSDTVTMKGSVVLAEDVTVAFEGASNNDHETTLTVVDPTDDRTVSLPDATDTLVGKATIDTLTNKTLNSGTNTIHADQWRSARTITVAGDASGSVSIDGTSNVTLTLTVEGSVKFVQVVGSGTLPSGTTASASGKILVAYGWVSSSTTTDNVTYLGYSSLATLSYGRGYGYGHGQCIATRAHGGAWDESDNPTGTIEWQYIVEMDVRS